MDWLHSQRDSTCIVFMVVTHQNLYINKRGIILLKFKIENEIMGLFWVEKDYLGLATADFLTTFR